MEYPKIDSWHHFRPGKFCNPTNENFHIIIIYLYFANNLKKSLGVAERVSWIHLYLCLFSFTSTSRKISKNGVRGIHPLVWNSFADMYKSWTSVHFLTTQNSEEVQFSLRNWQLLRYVCWWGGRFGCEIWKYDFGVFTHPKFKNIYLCSFTWMRVHRESLCTSF